jgi:hypothetical protein
MKTSAPSRAPNPVPDTVTAGPSGPVPADGLTAPRQLGEWQGALDLSAALTASMRERRAPSADITRIRFNDYGPLPRLDRTFDALTLLRGCLQVFRDTRDTEMIGKTLASLADVEDKLGHGYAAIRLGRDALRYKCLAGDVTATVVGYHNLGNFLHRHACQPTLTLASHLVAILICTLTGVVSAGPVRRGTADAADEPAVHRPARGAAPVPGGPAAAPRAREGAVQSR